MADELRDWEDWQLTQELRFRLRFEKAGTNDPIDMHSRILCEAIARILEREARPKSVRKIAKEKGFQDIPENEQKHRFDRETR